jgi:ankyrin repeat protein
LLYLVALSGNAQLFKLMLAKGARLETNPAKAPKPALFEYALKGGNLEIIRFLLGKGFASSLAEKTDALIFSAFSGHLPLVKYWLDSGVPVDAVKGQAFQEGATALMWAASSEKPNLPVMQYLIAQGAQPKREDERKNNLLHWAGHSGANRTYAILSQICR